MRYSQLFAKTLRQAPADAETVNHQLLVRGGFADQLISGVWSLLPLGLRVHHKIGEIIREEMETIGGQEVFLPTLQPKSLWVESDRWDHIEPPLFRIEDQHRREYALGPTHEEVMTDLVRRNVTSYRDLPFYLYQIQNKFRNEIRSTGGMLRAREFMMKDLYSFHTDESDLMDYFQKVVAAYKEIFSRCGLKVAVCEATGGTIGGKVTYEFHVLSPVGEDKIVFCPKCGWGANYEVRGEGDCPKCGTSLEISSSIEAGHVFAVGTKYSDSLKAEFVDKDGVKKPIWMGCYGIGLGRLMAAIVEVNHDERGIIWPEAVAPFKVHLLSLGTEDSSVVSSAEDLYERLSSLNFEVLYDDRPAPAGVKLTDADLIGIPWRVIVSRESLKGGGFEVKNRSEVDSQVLGFQGLQDLLGVPRP